MSDALIFSTIFVGFFVLRLVAATAFFLCILPEGDRCPNCDTPTLRVQSKGWNALMPWFRTSWCFACGWEGLLRRGELTPPRLPATGGERGAGVKGRQPRETGSASSD